MEPTHIGGHILRKQHTLRHSILAFLLIAFVAAFQSGCGNSRDEFVATGNQAQNGNLVFRFQKALSAQSVGVVPATTTSVRIDLFNSQTQSVNTLVVSQTFAFAETIRFENVPTNVVSALVTTFNADGLPTSFLKGSVQVVLGQDNGVDLGTATPVTFDSLAVTPDPVNLVVGPFGTNPTDQQQLTLTGTISGTAFQLPVSNTSATFVLSNTGLVNISSTGLLSVQFRGSNPVGNSDITTTYSYLGFQKSDVSKVNVHFYGAAAGTTPRIVPGGTYTGGFGTTLIRSNGVEVNTNGLATYSLQSAVTGVSIDSTTGVITATNAAVPGTEFNVVVTIVDNGTGGTGLTFTDTVKFTVVSAPI